MEGLFVATLGLAMPFFGRRNVVEAPDPKLAEAEARIADLQAENTALRTELHQFQSVQSATLTRFRTTFYELPIPCFTVDDRGHVMDWNRASESFFFRLEHEAVDHPITDILGSGIFRNDAEGMIYMVFMGLQPAPIDIELCVDGEPRKVKWFASPIKDSSGQVVGALNTLGVLPQFQEPAD